MSIQIMSPTEMQRTYRRFAMEFVEAYDAPPYPAIIGMQTRGVFIARRIADILSKEEGIEVDLGVLDVTFYRDDFRSRQQMPQVRISDIPFDLDGRDVILVDDVLYTGRTVRSAMDALMAYGRPRTIRFCCMVDRGHRELPISADYIGITVPTHQREEVRVRVKGLDGEDSIHLVTVPESEDGASDASAGGTTGGTANAHTSPVTGASAHNRTSPALRPPNKSTNDHSKGDVDG